MIAAKTAPGDGELRGGILPAQQGKQFVEDVAFVLQMSQNSDTGMRALVVPTLGIDRVGAKHLQLSLLDLCAQYADHAAIFVFEKLSHGSWEDENGSARVSEDEHLHFPVQFLAVTLVVFTIHGPEYLTRTRFPNTRSTGLRPEAWGAQGAHGKRCLAAALHHPSATSAGDSGRGIFR